MTPVMKRAHKLRSAGEIVFIDSTSSCESTHSTVTPLLVASKGGALPIGILIHKSQSTVCYEKGFTLVKENFPKCLGGKDVSRLLI